MTVVENPPVRKRRLLVLLPLFAFLALAVLLYFGLHAGDPSRIPSALIGREARSFNAAHFATRLR